MTRVNLMSPGDLTDQHLIAEYRELPRVFGAVRKKLAEGKEIRVGGKYTMGMGHVIFFYDKLGFLEQRYHAIVAECKKRGFSISYSDLDISDIPEQYKKGYHPTGEDTAISRNRIQEKLDAKPGFYRKYGKVM